MEEKVINSFSDLISSSPQEKNIEVISELIHETAFGMKAEMYDVEDLLLNKLAFLVLLADSDPTERISQIINKSFEFECGNLIRFILSDIESGASFDLEKYKS